VPHQNYRLVLHLKGAMDGFHIIGKGAERVLHSHCFETAFHQERDHFPPG
jgi:hypothetical protein